MTTQQSQTEWNSTKTKIKARFEKLSDDIIESTKDHMDLLTEKIQKAYGYTKEIADKEYAAFKLTLNKTQPEKVTVTETPVQNSNSTHSETKKL